MAATTADKATALGERWAGWIRFAGILMLIIAMIDFFQGLIAVIRGEYYAITPNQIVVFDLSTWGWLTMLWAVVVGLTGLGLLAAATWARIVTIIVVSINILAQLGFVGNAAYPLWALVGITLNIVVLYAVTVRWSEGSATMRDFAESRY
jgi:hypothetical protein